MVDYMHVDLFDNFMLVRSDKVYFIIGWNNYPTTSKSISIFWIYTQVLSCKLNVLKPRATNTKQPIKKGTITQIEPTLKEAAPSLINSYKLPWSDLKSCYEQNNYSR
jgi:hypothetical protein